MGLIATYVIGLLAEILDEQPEREAKYPWALGDPSPRTGLCRQLPFDAAWETRRLIVEVDEDQHRKPVLHFDKPHVITVSGVSRGEQRRLYDARKRAAARAQGYTLVEIPWERRPHLARRDRAADTAALRALLQAAGVKC